MREPQRKTIDDHIYEATPLPAGQGVRLLTTVAKTLGPALDRITSVAAIESAVFSALGTLAERLDPETLDGMCRTLAETTLVSPANNPGKQVQLKAVFDLHFSGDYGALFQWFAFAMEVNFGPLLQALKSRVQKRDALAPTK